MTLSSRERKPSVDVDVLRSAVKPNGAGLLKQFRWLLRILSLEVGGPDLCTTDVCFMPLRSLYQIFSGVALSTALTPARRPPFNLRICIRPFDRLRIDR